MGRQKRYVRFALAVVFISYGIVLASAILLRDVWAVAIVLGGIGFTLYLFYIWRQQKRQPQYPLVPPEGRGDIYLPRTDIPRPIYEDFRKMQEKKRKFQKLKKMARRKNS